MSIESQSWSTSIGLIKSIQTDQPDAWQRFTHIYTPLIYTWCRKAGLQEADSADVTQDVFRAVAAGIGGLQLGRPGDSFRGWLWTITRHQLGRFFNVRADRAVGTGGTDAQQQLLQVPDWIDDEQIPESLDAEQLLIRRATELIRNDFQEQTWQAFWLSAVEGLTSTEIAERLGMTSNGVRQAKFRVLARLREFIET